MMLLGLARLERFDLHKSAVALPAARVVRAEAVTAALGARDVVRVPLLLQVRGESCVADVRHEIPFLRVRLLMVDVPYTATLATFLS